ncbi:response regulator [Paenibacillus sp. LMG 31460]|uniref:Response regulator n=1 Tax=Paenibacillus germinis TaxID=2654979 RepID=A0ABX1YTY7_9BACL|nr:response regulator [Paenibacillus germinis]NOU84570.1 response regulator [Paenibacillus germinis]
MIKMVIADDEILTLDMLEHIIDWKKLGIRIVGKATNGKEALELIHRENPEILLTDIQMPHIGGIELIKMLAQSHPNLKIIILSAYGEFKYAQEAIRYGAAGYLVKPIDELELEEMINQSIKSNLEWIGKEQEAAYRKLLMTRNGTPALLQTMASKGIRVFHNFRMFIIQADPFSLNDQLLLDDQSSFFSDRVIQVIRQYMSEQSIPGYIYEFQEKEWLCIAEQSEGFGNHIIQLLLMELPFHVVVGVSDLKESLNQLHEAYSEAMDCLSYRFLFSSDNVLEYEELMLSGSGSSYYHEEVYMKVQSLTDEIVSEPLGYTDWRNKLTRILNETTGHPEGIYSLLFGMLVRLRMKKWEKNNGLDHAGIHPVSIEALKKYKTLEDLLDYLEQTIQQMGQEYNVSSQGNELVNKAKDYIQAHYNKQITLEAICSHISISKNYFSSLFKKETGMNVWDYLTIVRIEYAKKLLANTTLKNYEIAEQIGYENPSYFTKMFKKLTGALPQEYRMDPHVERG